MNIAIIGYRGIGKTSVAKMLAEKLGMGFVSVDDEIVFGVGMSINEMVDKKGWDFFREKEKGIIKNLENDNCVVDCGGGVVEDSENVAVLKENSKIILLTAGKETIIKRIKNEKTRPALTDKSPGEEVEEMLGKRQKLYENAADFTVDTTNLFVSEVVDKIIELIGK